MSQTSIASHFDTYPNTVYRWERRRTMPSMEVRMELLKLLEDAPRPLLEELARESGVNLASIGMGCLRPSALRLRSPQQRCHPRRRRSPRPPSRWWTTRSARRPRRSKFRRRCCAPRSAGCSTGSRAGECRSTPRRGWCSGCRRRRPRRAGSSPSLYARNRPRERHPRRGRSAVRSPFALKRAT